MVYAYDNWVQLPTRDLYDTQVMAMAINAAKDMYEKGQLEMKDFRKEYGDFMTPIAADQAWYDQKVTGKIRDTINALYALGIDPLRNAQGRAMISLAINSLPYGLIMAKRQRAENAREYYKAAGALAALNKYNKDFAFFLGEDPSQWAENDMGITAPTLFQTLKEATTDWYNNRTPRDLTADEIKQMGLDPRYQYSAFLDSDLMNIAKGLTPGWQGTPQANYYRHLAELKLKAAGVENPTVDQIESVLLRDIANAQQEWLVSPVKGHADLFEVLNQQFKNSKALQDDAQAFQKAMQDDAQAFEMEKARQAAKDKLDQIRARYGNNSSKNGGKSNPDSLNYSLTESIHHDLLFQGLRNSGIPIIKLTTDKNGELVPERDEKGNIKYINPEQASFNELEYSANYNNRYVHGQQEFFKNNSIKYAKDPSRVERMMKLRYGSRITGIQLASMLKRLVLKDGSIILSSGEAKLLRGTNGITSDAIGSKYNLTHDLKLAEIYNLINNAIGKKGIVGDVQIKFNLTDTGNNAVQISEKYNKGRTEVYANGTITVVGKNKEGNQIQEEITTNAWLPIGLNSENVAGNKKHTVSNVGLASNNQSAYSSIDANYMKAMGQQQKSNIGLFANSGIPMMIDPDELDIEDIYELMQNNL